MLDRADRHHPVEAAVTERQPQRVRLQERRGGLKLPAAGHLRPGQVDRDGMGAAPARLGRPVPIATSHVEYPLATQVIAEPAQEGPGLPVAAEVHLVAGEGDEVIQRHRFSLGGPAGWRRRRPVTWDRDYAWIPLRYWWVPREPRYASSHR